MKRKVIQIAESTQLISLPRKWAQRFGVKKGDEMDVTEEGTKLVVHTEKSPGLGSKEVDVIGLDRDSIMFLIRALYKNGYDEIKLNFNKTLCDNFRTDTKEPVMDVITREVSRLNGIEVFTQKENYCVIKSISEDTPKAFDTMLRRVFLLASETIGELIQGYIEGNIALLDTIQNKHDTITRFVSYSQRLLNKVGYHEYRKSNAVYHVLEIIDTLMDLVKFNARDIMKAKVKPSKEGIAIYKAVQNSFTTYCDLYYNFTLDKVFVLNKNRHMVLLAIKAAEKKVDKEELNLLISMEQVLEYILNLTNTRISLEY